MKKLLNCFLTAIDTLVVKLSRWKHIPGSKSNLFYLVFHRYKGETITLSDGTMISEDDLVAELHIDNKIIKSFEFTYSNLIKALQEELAALKKALGRELYCKLKAVYGITVFYSFAQRQGFTVIEIKNPFKRVFGSLWENILRLFLKKSDGHTRKKFVIAKECWLSRSQIEKMK